MKLGGDELIRVVVRQANFDKIAHKIDRMGDYKPEIVYEDADIIAKSIHGMMTAIAETQRKAKLRSLSPSRDEIDLPVIAAFRLLAAKLHRAASNLVEGCFVMP